MSKKLTLKQKYLIKRHWTKIGRALDEVIKYYTETRIVRGDFKKPN